MKEITMPSGAILKISVPPFIEARELLHAILEEAKEVELKSKSEIGDLLKDILCTAMASKRIEKALAVCLKRCTYNDLKIDESTFEPEEAREDYLFLNLEVVKEVTKPFTKTLMQLFSTALAKIPNIPA